MTINTNTYNRNLLICLILSLLLCHSYSKAQSCSIATQDILFPGSAIKLSTAQRLQLKQVAKDMRNNPSCSVVLVSGGIRNKIDQQRNWDRQMQCQKYLYEKESIDIERTILINSDSRLVPGSIQIRAAEEGEEGPHSTPPPHPNLRRR